MDATDVPKTPVWPGVLWCTPCCQLQELCVFEPLNLKLVRGSGFRFWAKAEGTSVLLTPAGAGQGTIDGVTWHRLASVMPYTECGCWASPYCMGSSTVGWVGLFAEPLLSRLETVLVSLLELGALGHCQQSKRC